VPGMGRCSGDGGQNRVTGRCAKASLTFLK
jgi:hypothetical protein